MTGICEKGRSEADRQTDRQIGRQAGGDEGSVKGGSCVTLQGRR